MKRTGIVSLGICAMAVSLIGCGSDTIVKADVFVASYVATHFVTTDPGGVSRNELQAGSTVSLMLISDGSTSGHLHIVASTNNPLFDADLAGTWTKSGNTIRITPTVDSFIKDMIFASSITDNTETLVGDQVFSGTRIELTLTSLVHSSQPLLPKPSSLPASP